MKIMKYYKWIVFLLLLVIGACIVGGYVMPVREGNKSKNKKNKAASTNKQDTANKDDSVTEKKKADETSSANTQETTNADYIGDTQDDTDQNELICI